MPSPVEILFDTSSVRDAQAQVLGLIPVFDRVARAGKVSVEASARDQVRAQKAAATEADKIAAASAKERTRLDKEASKEAERAERDRIRTLNVLNNMEVRDWQQKERQRIRESKQADNEIESSRKRVSESFGRVMGGAFGRVMGTASHIAGIATALGGGFAIADSLRAGVEQEKLAGVTFRGATNVGGFANQAEVQKAARATAIGTGGNTSDVLGGLDVFVRKTGDLGVVQQKLETGRTFLEDMARLSAATGTNFADMGNTAAEVQNQLGDAAKTMEVMRALAGQGRAGAIDIKDLGQYGGRLAASAAQFTGPLSANIESFGAIAQLAKKLGGATDTAEATESVARLGSDFAKHAEGFKAIGVDVFADKGHTKFRNAEDIITEAVVKSKGDQGVLRDLFGERSIRAALGAQVAFSNAGGGTAGEAAIRSQFSSLKATTLTQNDVDEGLKSRMAENDAKLAVATENFHAALNDRLLPLLPGLIDQFTRLIPEIEKFLDFLVKNPWVGIGGLVGAALVGEVTKAGIAVIVEKAFAALMSQALVAAGAGKAAAAAQTALLGGEAAAVGGTAATAAGSAAGAAGIGGTILGAGVAGLGALIPLGFAYLGEKREEKGAKAIDSILSLPEGTDEEKQAKRAALEDARTKGLASQHFDALARRGQENDLGNFAGGNAERLQGMDRSNAALAAALDKITTKLEAMNAAMNPDKVASFTDAMKLPNGPHADVPSGAWPNTAP